MSFKYLKGSCWRSCCHVRALSETAMAWVFKITGNNLWCKGKWEPATQPVEKRRWLSSIFFFSVTERHYYHIEIIFLNSCCSFRKPTSFMPFSLEQNEMVVSAQNRADKRRCRALCWTDISSKEPAYQKTAVKSSNVASWKHEELLPGWSLPMFMHLFPSERWSRS